MIDDLAKRLTGLEISRITEENADAFASVYTSNAAFFALSQEGPSTREGRLNDITAVPEGFDPKGKCLLGIYEKGEPAAVLDYLAGFPDKDCLWIGLLMIHKEKQGRGLGRLITAALLDAARGQGFKACRLGVIYENAPGLAFWKGRGFAPVRESLVERLTIK